MSVKTATDGQVRSAVVQTASGLYDKPAVKLAVLDIGANDSESEQVPITGGDCCARYSHAAAPTHNRIGH